MSHPLDVAVAVIRQKARVLIAQRLPEDDFGGFWEFPGGKQQPQESLEDCLIREMKEELDIEVSVGLKLQLIEHPYPERVVRLHCYACQITEGKPSAKECSDWKWVGVEELDQFQFPPASQPIVEQLQTAPLV